MDKSQPAYRGDEPYVFVCYAHADEKVVYPEIGWLQDQGVRIWYDEGISAGRVWRAEIGEAIEGADKVLFYISAASLKSDHCNREISVALDEEKEILPVYLEDTSLTPDLKIGLARLQALHRTGDDDYRRHLLEALGHTAPAEISSTPPKPPDLPVEMPAIAVLPFDNLSGDSEQEFFSEGIAEDILNGLAHSPDVVVRARNSSFALKGQQVDTRTIAERLNVTHVVNGSVRTSGNRVRVNARLTTVAQDVDVWSDRYDRELIDVFAVQDEITGSILNALDLHFSGSERQRVSLDAYEAFLMGRYHSRRFEIPAAISGFEKAIEIEPDYAEALSSLSGMYGVLDTMATYSEIDPGDFLEKARVYSEKAVKVNPDTPVPPAPSAPTQQRLDELNRLIRRYPNNPNLHVFYAHVFRRIGRSDLELRVLEHCIALDPLSGVAYRMRGDAKLFAGMFEEALADFETCERFGHVPSHFYPAQVAFFQRDAKRLEELVEATPAWAGMGHFRTIMAGATHYLRGDAPGIARALEPLEAQGSAASALVRFWVELLKGQDDLALAHYRDALQQGNFPASQSIQGYAGLRSMFPTYFAQSGYEAMLREFNFDSASIAELVIPDLPF